MILLQGRGLLPLVNWRFRQVNGWCYRRYQARPVWSKRVRCDTTLDWTRALFNNACMTVNETTTLTDGIMECRRRRRRC